MQATSPSISSSGGPSTAKVAVLANGRIAADGGHFGVPEIPPIGFIKVCALGER
jgi:hypothetical protein